jgi:hypothetical protein
MKCESLIGLETKVDFLIFTNSFQFINPKVCEEVINKILCKDGFLLILLPLVSSIYMEMPKNEKNKKWRKQILGTIKIILNMNNFELVCLDTTKGQHVLLLKKTV